jgi:hypothetical protein
VHEGLGFRFYAGMFGVVIAGAVVFVILFLIFDWAVYTWGIFGAFVAIAAVLLLIAWFYDRRKVRQYEDE